MPGSSNNSSSFIPKRGPSRNRKPRNKKQLFIFTILTYSFLFAALLAAGATFLYKNYLNTQLETQVAALKVASQTFSTVDLARVREFDVALKRATERLDNSASIVAILDGLDDVTVQPVQIESLQIERQGDQSFSLEGEIITSSFDAAMFQRKIYNLNSKLFSSFTLQEVTLSNEIAAAGEGSDPATALEDEQRVTFSVALTVPLEEVLYDPETARKLETSVVVPVPLPSASTSTTTEVVATEEIAI